MNTQPEIRGLSELMARWTDAELQAFFCCVRASDANYPPVDRETLMSRSVEELFWAYNSKAKAQASYAAAKTAQIAYDHMPDAMKRRLPAPPAVRALHEYGATLSCEKHLPRFLLVRFYSCRA